MVAQEGDGGRIRAIGKLVTANLHGFALASRGGRVLKHLAAARMTAVCVDSVLSKLQPALQRCYRSCYRTLRPHCAVSISEASNFSVSRYREVIARHWKDNSLRSGGPGVGSSNLPAPTSFPITAKLATPTIESCNPPASHSAGKRPHTGRAPKLAVAPRMSAIVAYHRHMMNVGPGD